MMQQITRQYLRDLATTTGFPRATLHTPMVRAGREVQQNRIRLENAATEATRALESADFPSGEAETFVQPIRDLASDDNRMQHQLGGMSLFLDRDEIRILESSFVPRETCEVGSRFSVLQVLEPALENREYAILTLSQGGVGLYRASRYRAELVELEGLPEDLCYVLRYDEFEKSVHHHSSARGGSAVVHHGHGEGKDEHDRFVSRFVEAVEPVVTRYVTDERLPLVLIGTEEVLGRYRAHTGYAGLRARQEVVDPHTIDLDGLIRIGWECMRPGLDEEHRAMVERLRGHGRTANGIHEVLPAVSEGRVETLFLDPASDIRGAFDPQRERVSPALQIRDGREELVNLAACFGLLNGAGIVLVGPEDAIDHPAAILY